jgi:uncharacterized membrane protein
MLPLKSIIDFYGIIYTKYTRKNQFVKPDLPRHPEDMHMSIISQVIHDLLFVHPPHTLLVHFPIALTSAALFFIILFLWKKSVILETIAFADISLAAISTVFAAIVGIRDNATFYHGLAPNHIMKIILASLLFIVTATLSIVRWKNPKVLYEKYKYLYVMGYFLSFALVAVLGYLGGVIVFGG